MNPELPQDRAEHRAAQAGASPRHRSRRKRALVAIALLLGSGTAALIYEARTSHWQARLLAPYASGLTFAVEPGASDAIRFPLEGPFDQRLGYARLPVLLERLQDKGMAIEHQARFSPALLAYVDRGLFPPYAEKSQAGLALVDCRAQPIYRFDYPLHGYGSFDDVPPLVVSSLLFIENRGLLDPARAQLNPAVDWSRFALAALQQLAKELGLEHQNMGGSTLATQIEKYRHSAEGLTSSNAEKLRQMVSASVRAYQTGPATLEARQALVLAYLNTVPLAAAPGNGAVHGLGDGLWVWFGADFAAVNRLLAGPAGVGEQLAQQGLALRRVVALMIAQRRPSFYLAQGREELERLTDSHLRLMTVAGELDARMRDAALAQTLQFRDFRADPAVTPMPTNKGVTMARSRLTGLLEVGVYELDRLDLLASTTLQGELQAQVTAYLNRLRDPAYAQQMGLVGERLLTANQAQHLRYSFTLFERTAQGNRVRVQTDNTDQPFDINEGSKLELGSTAKVRVLVSYLEVIAELHAQFAALPPPERQALTPELQDRLALWMRDYLIAQPEADLAQTLDAALERRYSANPRESFFTGGGVHTFSNFRSDEDLRNPTVREALRESHNLPFVRMLQDVVDHLIARNLEDRERLLGDDGDPRRQEFLRRFADREGLVFLQRFWRKYQDRGAEERLETFLAGLRPATPQLAAVHRYLRPTATVEEFAAFLGQRQPQERLSQARINELYRLYGPGAQTLPDQAHIARVHPLELWLVAYLQGNPDANFAQISEASQAQRQEVYGWLVRTRAKNARDSRIRTMLEVEAFTELHQRWRRTGYPFDHLVPSLATALGSSGDRPAALAELMGIIVNDGMRQPTLRIDTLHFGRDTPYETQLRRQVESGEQVMAPEVAAALRSALAEVVGNGTARRLRGGYLTGDGAALPIGGKTGTGDNRVFTVGANGQRVNGGRALNRTATFVFYLGPDHYGTLTAFVPGQEAAGYRFTSALPVQVLRGMAPILLPHLEAAAGATCGDGRS